MTSTVQDRKHHNMLWYVKRKSHVAFEKILPYPCVVHVHFSCSCLETSLGHMLLQSLIPIHVQLISYTCIDSTCTQCFHLQWTFYALFHVLHTVCFCWTERETKVQRIKCYPITCGWQSRFYYNSSLCHSRYIFFLSITEAKAVRYVNSVKPLRDQGNKWSARVV